MFIHFCKQICSFHRNQNFSSKLESSRFNRTNESRIEQKKRMEVKKCCWCLSLRTGCLIFVTLEIIYLIGEFVSGEHWQHNVVMLPFPLLGLLGIYLVSESSNRVRTKEKISWQFSISNFQEKLYLLVVYIIWIMIDGLLYFCFSFHVETAVFSLEIKIFIAALVIGRELQGERRRYLSSFSSYIYHFIFSFIRIWSRDLRIVLFAIEEETSRY